MLLLLLAAALFDLQGAGRFARLALDCVAREYPNKIAHVLNSDQDVQPPRQLTPAFYGCYDWHSSVHGHWLLARLARTFPDASFTPRARQAVARSLTLANIQPEVRYLQAAGRASFERPYGLAWVLQLGIELREWETPEARRWSATLQPLEQAAAARLKEWLPKLSHPVRSGEHSQSAFALALALEWARAAGDREFEALIVSKVRAFYLADRACPLNYEPSGEDFFSPCLAGADVVRRVLKPAEFAAWLARFLPAIPRNGSGGWLAPVVSSDPSDPRLAHLDGLNLSRAWMLEGIAAALPGNDPRLKGLAAATAAHRRTGLASVTGAHYEGSHWLGSFAVYLVTQRGILRAAPHRKFSMSIRSEPEVTLLVNRNVLRSGETVKPRPGVPPILVSRRLVPVENWKNWRGYCRSSPGRPM